LEFLDRFLLHVLPSGFMRIRHYGLLANRHKRERLAQARAALNRPAPAPAPAESVQAFCLRVLGIDIERCPICRIGTLRLIGTLAPQLGPRPRPP
jgi:Putative transposase